MTNEKNKHIGKSLLELRKNGIEQRDRSARTNTHKYIRNSITYTHKYFTAV